MITTSRFARPADSDQPQIGNANPDFVDLSPVTWLPYYRQVANYIALTPGQDVPLIWEEVTPDAIQK